MEFQRLPGELLDIGIQIHDEMDAFPLRAFYQVRGEDGELIGNTEELPHIGGGYFKEQTETMPSNRQITVHILIRLPGTEESSFDSLEISDHHSAERFIYRRADAAGSIGQTVLERLDRRLSEIAFPLVDFDGEIIDQEVICAEIED